MNYHILCMTQIARVAVTYRHTRLHLGPPPLLCGQLVIAWVPFADAGDTILRPGSRLLLLKPSDEFAVRVRWGVKLPLCP